MFYFKLNPFPLSYLFNPVLYTIEVRNKNTIHNAKNINNLIILKDVQIDIGKKVQ